MFLRNNKKSIHLLPKLLELGVSFHETADSYAYQLIAAAIERVQSDGRTQLMIASTVRHPLSCFDGSEISFSIDLRQRYHHASLVCDMKFYYDT